jgi:hypothetical protein
MLRAWEPLKNTIATDQSDKVVHAVQILLRGVPHILHNLGLHTAV